MSLKEKLEWWLEKKLGGHIDIGPVTVYGFNAMHVAINIWTRRFGSICFHPDLRFLGRLAPWMLREHPWYFYMSPCATPWAATFAIGPGVSKEEKIDAIRRWMLWGHNYRVSTLREDGDGFDPQSEREFFWQYVYDYQRMKKMKEAESDGICGACGGELTTAEASNSNVCLRCLFNEMERVASRIKEMDGQPTVN